MDEQEIARSAARAARRLRRSWAEDLDSFREDAGLSRAALARASGVDPAFLHRILDGTARPSVETYARLAAALGADLCTRIYPSTGPAIRDRHQARMLEALLGLLHPRWQPFTEVAVRRPGRGWIDAVLHDSRERTLVATEIQSGLQRLEQLVRWSAEKAASLTSWDGWPHLGDEPRVSQLLLVRRTRASVRVADAFTRQLRVAYPAHPDDALAALTGAAPWPGAAVLWAVLDGHGTRMVARR